MRRRARTRPLLAGLSVLALVIISLASSAFAQSYDELGKSDQRKFAKLLDKCIADYDRERFGRAQELCAKAAELTNHPATHYVVARIRDREGKCEEAVAAYRSILDTEPPGAAEAKWLEEYRESITEHLGVLGDCSARLDVLCADADHGAVISVRGQALATCPSLVSVKPGQQDVELSSPGKETATKSATATPGRPTKVSFKRLSKRSQPEGAGVVAIACPGFAKDAVLSVNDVAIGVCPISVSLVPGQRLVTATSVDGTRGAAIIEVDPSAEGQALKVAPFRSVSVECADPEVHVVIEHPWLSSAIDATCGELARGSTLTLPQDTLSLHLTRDLYQEQDQPVTIEASTQSIAVVALERLPVPFSVSCTDTSDPPVYVKVGDTVRKCPFEGEVPEGTHVVEARREGYEPWTMEVDFTGGQNNEVRVPMLESTSFFTPGVITTFGGGVLVAAALGIDLAGLGTLDELKQISDGDFTVCGDEDPRDCYDDRKSSVKTTITTTRILYAAGVLASAVGVGLIIWEVADEPEADFGRGSEASLQVVPMVSADAAGPVSGVGLTLTW